MESYRVVAKRASATLVVRKSQFIATIAPAKHEGQARSFIEEIRETYKEANHNVWAYRIGHDEQIKFSDDGEPGGTAGRPILEVLQREDIRNAAIVVTRYFGGILLGAGGLVRAYSKSATQVLKKAPKGFMIRRAQLQIKLDYPSLGKLQNELATINGQVEDAQYGADVELTFLVSPEQTEYVKGFIMDLTNGNCEITQLEPRWTMVKNIKDGDTK